MAVQNQTIVQSRESLEKTVKQQIMLSIGLDFEKKDALLKKLKSLSEDQLMKLKDVFDEENKRKEKLLTDFFAKNPQLYPDYERFSREHVNSIYAEVERDEKDHENARLEEIIQSYV